MTKPSQTVRIMQETVKRLVAEQTRARLFMSYDAAILAANKVFHMGPGRAGAFQDAYNEAMEELAVLFLDDAKDNGDSEIAYAKGTRDARIRQIVGDGLFIPFDLGYGGAYMDELHRVRTETRRAQFPLWPGDTVWILSYDEDAIEETAEVTGERVTGVGFEGFCISALSAKPDDMSDMVPWRDVGREAFLTRPEADAALARLLRQQRGEATP